jgi:hypothetical protein
MIQQHRRLLGRAGDKIGKSLGFLHVGGCDHGRSIRIEQQLGLGPGQRRNGSGVKPDDKLGGEPRLLGSKIIGARASQFE